MAKTENGFHYSVEDECAVIIGYSDTIGTTLTIPDTLVGYPVVKVGNSVFSGYTQLTMPVSMAVSPNPEDPDNAASCLKQLFGASASESVSRVTLTGAGEIGSWAFAYTKLSGIDMSGNDVTAIGMSAFAKATGLTEVKFSSGLATLDDTRALTPLCRVRVLRPSGQTPST